MRIMFLIILTVLLCMTAADLFTNFNESELALNCSGESFYNVYDWVAKLNLQRCSFVAVGLKYFAIFVEDGRQHYFLGVCNLNTLSEWKFCTPELLKQRKSKCCLKLRSPQYHIRVHRRFCDMQLMINNKDCVCSPTVFGEAVYKVIGFPTCYISPSPSSLCRYYNVCGLSQCRTTTVEGRVHAVECNPNCKGRQPFCEYPIGSRTSLFPEVTSFWSEWREVGYSESRKVHSVATCINKYTREGAVDCLGPGTSCCPLNVANCSCNTYIEDGVLKLRRIMYGLNRSQSLERDENDSEDVEYNKYIEKLLDKALSSIKLKKRIRHIRDIEEYDDDDDSQNDVDDDIAIEESEDDETPAPTTESMENDEVIQEVEKELMHPSNFTDPDALDTFLNRTTSGNGLDKCICCLHLVGVVMVLSIFR